MTCIPSFSATQRHTHRVTAIGEDDKRWGLDMQFFHALMPKKKQPTPKCWTVNFQDLRHLPTDEIDKIFGPESSLICYKKMQRWAKEFMRLFLGKKFQISPLFKKIKNGIYCSVVNTSPWSQTEGSLRRKHHTYLDVSLINDFLTLLPAPLQKALFQSQLLYSTSVHHDIAVEAEKLPKFLTEFLNL